MQNDGTHLARVRSIMNKYAIHPKKRLGQHFLMDHNILSKIAGACELGPEDYVVEIGTGLGVLTGYLAEKARGVLSIEIDAGLAPVLEETLGDIGNIKLLFADILKVDVEQELQKAFAPAEGFTYKVCANLPYYITTPIIFHLLEKTTCMQCAVLMMQKEVADRLVASPGGKDYGLVTVMVTYHARVEMVSKVSRHCFYPRPEVESAVLRVIPWQVRPWVVKDETIFKGLVRAAFQKRRKTIQNIVAALFDVDKEEVARRLDNLGIEPRRRPETLGIEEFREIADAFFRIGGADRDILQPYSWSHDPGGSGG